MDKFTKFAREITFWNALEYATLASYLLMD